MGYAICFGTCYGCKQPFSFNPDLVPSIRIDGVKQPVCRTCIERANPMRIKNGLEPVEILPGAYDEFDEAEVL